MAMELEIKANTSEAERNLDNLGKKIQEINNPQNEQQKQQEAEKQSLVSVKDNMKSLTDTIKDLTRSLKENKSFQGGDIQGYNPFPSNRIQQDKREVNFEDLSRYVGSLVKNVSRNDFTTPLLETTANTSSKVKSIGEKLITESGDNGDGGNIIGSLLSKVGGVGLGLTALGIAGSALSDRYEKDLPYTTKILSSFGTNLTDDAKSNQDLADRLRATLVDYNRNTGLANNEFLEYASSLSRFGIGEGQEAKAGELTQKAANIALLTNGDISQNLDFMGLIERFGGNGAETLNQVYNSAKLQGLDKNQFPEFLSNLQRVIEDGISRGYIKSTKEVATDLAIFSELGKGNAFFEGEYGARTYSQMSNGLANATNLNSTSSVLVYKAAQNTLQSLGVDAALNTSAQGGGLNAITDSGAQWLNTMAYIEQGPMNTDFLKNLTKQVNDTYGNDTASKVLTYKEAFGLNYQGAIRIFNLLEELSSAESAGQIENIKAQMEEVTSTQEFKSSETALADSMSKLDKSIHDIAQGTFNIKSVALDTISGSVDAIRDWLLKTTEENKTTQEHIETSDLSEENKEFLTSTYEKTSGIKMTMNNDWAKIGASQNAYTQEGKYFNEFYKNNLASLVDQGLLNENISQLYNEQKKSGSIDANVKAEYDLYSKIMALKQDRSTTISQRDQTTLENLFNTLVDSLGKLKDSTDNAAKVYATTDAVVNY